jgi:thymidine kinase
MLEVITGCMYSGKSEELIRRLRRCQIAGQGVIAFKSARDDRYSADIATHPIEGVPSTLKAHPVADVDAFLASAGLEYHDPSDPGHDRRWSGRARYVRYERVPRVEQGLRCRDEYGRPMTERIPTHLPQVLGFDEVQFMGKRVVSVLEDLANQGVRVIVAGLDLDSDGKPFGPMARLLAVADKVAKLTAVCVDHNHEKDGPCGKPATRSFRLPSQDSGEQVQVGSAGMYEARCRVCWARGRQ